VQKCQVLTEQVRWARVREPAAASAIVGPALEQDLSVVSDSAGDLGVVGDIGALMAAVSAMDAGHGFGAKVIIQAFIHE
jgi:hypothetical protein